MRPDILLLAWGMSAVLGLIALMHLLWGLGVSFPRGDRSSLARTVIGAAGRDGIMPSSSACVLVALMIGAVTLLPLIQVAVILTPLYFNQIQAAALVVAAVFALRGLAAWTPMWRRRFPGRPFADLDRWLYGPLCLALAAGFLTLEFCHPR